MDKTSCSIGSLRVSPDAFNDTTLSLSSRYDSKVVLVALNALHLELSAGASRSLDYGVLLSNTGSTTLQLVVLLRSEDDTLVAQCNRQSVLSIEPGTELPLVVELTNRSLEPRSLLPTSLDIMLLPVKSMVPCGHLRTPEQISTLR